MSLAGNSDFLKSCASSVSKETPKSPIQFTKQNPLCGDTVTLYGSITEDPEFGIFFHLEGIQTESCLICSAASGLLSLEETTWNRSLVENRISELQDLVEGEPKENEMENFLPLSLKWIKLSNITASYPTRIKCLLLPWIGLKELLLAEEKNDTDRN